MKRSRKKEEKKAKETQKTDLTIYCRNFGIGLIILGIVHFIPYLSLDPAWGVLLVFTGIFALIFRKKSTILLLGFVLFFVGVLNVYTSLYNLAADSNSSLNWIWIGIFQVYLGVLEFIKYNKIRKDKEVIEKAPKRRIYERISYIIIALIFLFYIYVTFFVQDYGLYKIEDGKEIIISSLNCNPPYMEIGLRCCIPYKTYNYMCDDEGEEYSAQLNKLIKANLTTTKERLFNKDYNLSFESSPGYFLIKNVEYGKMPVLYSFYSFVPYKKGSLENDEIIIDVVYFGSTLANPSDWKKEAREELNQEREANPEGNISIIKTKEGYEVAVYVDSGKTDSIIEGKYLEDYKIKIFTFLDFPIKFEFSATGDLITYESDLDEMVDTIKFHEISNSSE